MVKVSKQYEEELEPVEGIVKQLKEFQTEITHVISLVDCVEFNKMTEKEINRIASIISISSVPINR